MPIGMLGRLGQMIPIIFVGSDWTQDFQMIVQNNKAIIKLFNIKLNIFLQFDYMK